jgi:ubiquitin carboxyl-terminal hydrolase 36/42
MLELGKAVCPDWFIKDSADLHERFKGPMQQDAHEYFIALLGRFRRECCNAVGARFMEPETLLTHYFSWKLKSNVLCSGCGFVEDKTVDFVDWTVPVREVRNIATVVNELTVGEPVRMHGPCPHCGAMGSCMKTTVPVACPLILTMTLMRFDNQLRKVDEFVEYPDILHVRGGEYSYQLYGMIVHEGRVINHGHFFAYVRDKDGVWYKADDLCVFRVKPAVVMNTTPYVLFYRMIM